MTFAATQQRGLEALDKRTAQGWRWDLEQWLAIANVNKFLNEGSLHQAMQVLETPRQHRHLGATLDKGGSEQLIEALRDARMDLKAKLDAKFQAREADIMRWQRATEESALSVHQIVKFILDGVHQIEATCARKGVLSGHSGCVESTLK